MTKISDASQRVSDIYRWIDEQISANAVSAGTCNMCGKCCDFEQFGHLLFVTSLEVAFLEENIKPEKIKKMPAGVCPYNIDNTCSIHDFRFAGCRIFTCKGDADFQSKLSEMSLDKLKAVCRELQIPYRYKDLASALNETVGK